MKGSWRLLSRRLHMWLGLSVGMILVLISLSGAAIVFYVELDRWLHPQLQMPMPRSGEPDWEHAVRTLRATYPDKTGPWRLEVTSDQQLIPARYNQPPETRGQHFAPLLVWLSADGLQVLRQDYWGQSLLTWLYNLHYQLLLGATGTLLLGYLGIATLVLLTSGLLAWWPRKGQWRKSLQFKPRRSKSGLLYDWHKTVGLCCLLPLLLLFTAFAAVDADGGDAGPAGTDPVFVAVVARPQAGSWLVILVAGHNRGQHGARASACQDNQYRQASVTPS